MSSTPSPLPQPSTAPPESLLRPALLTASWEGGSRAAADLPANDTLSQSFNDTMNSTDALGYPTESSEPNVTTPAPIKATSSAENLTDVQDRTNLPDSDNQTLTTSDITLSTNATTSVPKDEPKTGTAAPSTSSQTSQITTRPPETTTQIRDKYLTVTTRGRFVSTTTITTTTTTQSTELSSTLVLAKARVDSPSELNVGDDVENTSTSMDPLLAGLVSVFVVTAAIVALLIFLKFRHRNERPEFRRLQDLPMDDMMEDTPLSMYSY
ncbi:hypothetical protein Baya_9410 [Bagarius yarrelli]|uniref:Uncharacterized protein n=1 Tax=Bagarius yarrelli TaxID=175774 RepID=A0A556U6L0_BAGYA|nr:hypothetical protein Baya_9410 [Bagarius yarrelli]